MIHYSAVRGGKIGNGNDKARMAVQNLSLEAEGLNTHMYPHPQVYENEGNMKSEKDGMATTLMRSEQSAIETVMKNSKQQDLSANMLKSTTSPGSPP